MCVNMCACGCVCVVVFVCVCVCVYTSTYLHEICCRVFSRPNFLFGVLCLFEICVCGQFVYGGEMKKKAKGRAWGEI